MNLNRHMDKWDALHADGKYFDVPYAKDLRKNYDSPEEQTLVGLRMDGTVLDLPKDGHKMRMLEVGSGYGGFGARLASYVEDYYGVDISQVVVNDGNKAIREAGIANMMLFHTPDGFLKMFADNFFDIVFSTGVFIHIAADQTKNYLRETARVLKPTGKFFHHFNISTHGTPNHNEWTAQLFNDAEMEEMFKDTGLRIIENLNDPPFADWGYLRYVFGEKK